MPTTQHRHVIADLIRNPEGRGAGANNTTPSRHCGLDPQSRGAEWSDGTVLFTLAFDSSPLMETFAKPTVIPA